MLNCSFLSRQVEHFSVHFSGQEEEQSFSAYNVPNTGPDVLLPSIAMNIPIRSLHFSDKQTEVQGCRET